ncbi:hypothetical protein SGRA_2452 [Saprospira grandis str. Lewin]|uniref:Uncharacterized protein n=1 Tax=Saprospira grandis (strain Lewin) TaxID=984262 RepID=H6L5G4_SAPGL|nr:hypothetical protein SGRA_2452 [Saprospira grandis str. Lewin]
MGPQQLKLLRYVAQLAARSALQPFGLWSAAAPHCSTALGQEKSELSQMAELALR